MEYFENFGLISNIIYLLSTGPTIFILLQSVSIIIIIISGMISLFSNIGNKLLFSVLLAVMIVCVGFSLITRDISFTGSNIEERISTSQLNEYQKKSLNDIYAICKEKMSEKEIIVLQKNLEMFLSEEKEMETSKKDEYINLIIEKERENKLAVFEEPTKENESKEEKKLNKIYWILIAIFILFIFRR